MPLKDITTGSAGQRTSCLASESTGSPDQIVIAPYETTGSGKIEMDGYASNLPERLSRVSYGNEELVGALKQLADQQGLNIQDLRARTILLPSLSGMMVEQRHAG